MESRIQEKQDIQAHPRRSARWLWLTGAAVGFAVIGLGYAVLKSSTADIGPGSPAVLATPSAAPNVPPPAPETTTGTFPRTPADGGSQRP